MSALVKTTVVEAKLLLREPIALWFGILFPTVLLLGMGAIPALREPSAAFGGARFVDFWTPTALVMSLAVLGLQHIPTVVSTYRENGVLRRMATTPVHPATLLAAQLLVVLAASVVSAGLLMVSSWLLLDVPLPRDGLWFALAFVVGFTALLAIGLLVAATAPNPRAAGGLAVVAFMLVMLVGGVYVPRFLLPDFLVSLGNYAPPGVQALLDAWLGSDSPAAAIDPAGPPMLVRLGIMALIAVTAGLVAARLFRWK
ncbi:MAG TPA: ABC transporter permease [Actinopolymorphaceae bacterium]|jgi:ABC-2 type transport system permease protein